MSPISDSMPSVIVGCGYVGQQLMEQLSKQSEVLGVRRSRLEHQPNMLSVDLDEDCLDKLASVCDAANLYYFLAPSALTDRDERSRRLIEALGSGPATPASVVLISTTGVYGDCAGAWVDETWPARPTSSRSIRRADAEKAWTQFAGEFSCPLAILRVAGIYGPNKLPIPRLLDKQPLLSVEHAPYSNRVHVRDLVDTVIAATGLQLTVNVADGSPSTMTEYFHVLADTAGIGRLPERSWQQLESHWSAGMRNYMTESRRIDNSVMRNLLGRDLRYPTLTSGIAASIEASDLREFGA